MPSATASCSRRSPECWLSGLALLVGLGVALPAPSLAQLKGGQRAGGNAGARAAARQGAAVKADPAAGNSGATAPGTVAASELGGGGITTSPLSISPISVSPITGTSTLDQLRPGKGDAIDLQFPSGFSCRVASGDVPSVIVYGDQGSLGAASTTLASGTRAGLAVIVPLYRTRRAMCDKSMELQNALSQLEIAEKLVTTGAMTNEEFLELSRRIKAQTLGV